MSDLSKENMCNDYILSSLLNDTMRILANKKGGCLLDRNKTKFEGLIPHVHIKAKFTIS